MNTDMRGQLQTVEAVKKFIEAGKATLTIQSKKTGTRFTYRFSRSAEEPGKNRPVWISVMNGADNESSYAYIGTLWIELGVYSFRRTAKSKVTAYAPSMIAITWLLDSLNRKANVLEQLEVWHEGTCGRCGRKLTVPSSIASGFGPECVQHV